MVASTSIYSEKRALGMSHCGTMQIYRARRAGTNFRNFNKWGQNHLLQMFIQKKTHVFIFKKNSILFLIPNKQNFDFF
jgi:hypothetical protein